MDSNQVINHRQLCWLVGSTITGGGLLLVQHELIRIGKMDAWFSYLGPLLYTFLIGYVFYLVSLAYPGKNLFEITRLIMGKWIGNIVNLVIVVNIWFDLMRDLRGTSKFFNTVLLPNTPEEIILLMLVLLVMYFGNTSVEVIARVNDIFFPIFVIMFIMLPVLLANEIDWQLMEPVLAVHASEIYASTILNSSWYGDIIVIGAFLHTVSNSKQMLVSFRHGAVIATILLTIFTVSEIMVFGFNMPGNMIYPGYHLVQQISITDFLDRMDLFVLSIWFPILICKITFMYLAFLTGLCSFIGQRDYSQFNKPTALFLLITSLMAFKSTTEVFSYGNYSSVVIVLSYQPLLFVLLYILARRKAKPSRTGTEQEQSSLSSGSKAVNRQQNQPPFGSIMSRLPHRLLSTVTFGMSAVSILLIATGLMYSRHYPKVGISCGIGYAVCLLLILLSSYMEIMKARRLGEN
jgi:spore germination protein (amino acid permease)